MSDTNKVTMSADTFHKLFIDATRWRAFESAGHLMIVDFDQRVSGTFYSTKRTAVDRLIVDEAPTQGGEKRDE